MIASSLVQEAVPSGGLEALHLEIRNISFTQMELWELGLQVTVLTVILLLKIIKRAHGPLQVSCRYDRRKWVDAGQ